MTDIQTRWTGEAARPRELALELRGISKEFSGVVALRDVTLEVAPGEVHALLGENGAGKSTLMNVATGALTADEGAIIVNGEEVASWTPAAATRAGIAIVHQHPAVLPDLTVLENLQVALPASVFAGRSTTDRARELLEAVDLDVPLWARVEDLSVARKHLLEIAKALAVEPRILILDEPTAPLDSDSTALLFRLVRRAVSSGTAVVYITHRLAEVRELADAVTVLRDGRLRATARVSDVTDDELLALIVGRQLDSTFPPKLGTEPEETVLRVTGLTGDGFTDVALEARRGEIVGIAGVVGNGQAELMRALAGLEQFSGNIELSGAAKTQHQLISAASYMPADRHREGLMMQMTVGENAAVSALKRFTRGPLLSGRREAQTVGETLQSLAVKARSVDTVVSTLSGGNQQKVVMARTLLAEPKMVLADEPTQGVDVGARAEIYTILRTVASRGVPVVVASSDAKELEGLCDRVVVMSRGHVVDTLVGDDVTEERMLQSALRSRTHTVRAVTDRQSNAGGWAARFQRFLKGDYAPSVLLVGVIVLLAAYIFSQNDRYLNDFNVGTVLTLGAAIGFIALGQTVALLTGGIDLSVGPLAGLLVVVASFFINEGSPWLSILLGFVAMVGVSLLVGFVNGSLIRLARFTPIAATLAMYIALQGLAFVLRNTPGGYISQDVIAVVNFRLGPLPLSFVLLVVLVVALEWALRKTRWGWNLRAAGSNEDSARRVGVNVDRTVLLGYVVTSLLTFLGAIMLMAQIGLGDPAQGVGYTLTSITAVVLGGTSLLGGRGTFVGTLLGSVLLVQVMNATVFLRLDQMWQYVLQGLLILVAAIVFSVARSRKRRLA